LIEANPRLKKLFEDDRISKPKPIHITTLFKKVSGKRIALYPKIIPTKEAKPRKEVMQRLRKVGVVLKGGEEYFFFIGCKSQVAPEVVRALGSLSSIRVNGLKFTPLMVEPIEELVPRDEERNWDGNVTSIKVVFETPVLIRDPYLGGFRRFLPLSGWLFSVNLYDLFGSVKKTRTLSRKISNVLRETYSALHSVKLVWYLYEGHVYPALIGYIKYFIYEEALKRTPEVIDILPLLLKHARIMGIGTSRAAGFGHVNISVNNS